MTSRPQTLDDIVGQPEAVAILRKVVDALKTGPPTRALFLHGPTGLGKTTSARALEHEIDGAFLVEYNCAEMSGAQLREALKEMATTREWEEGGREIVLFDEVDRLSKADRIALRQPLEEAYGKVLIVFTANRPLGDAGLVSRSIPVPFVPLDDVAARTLALRKADEAGAVLTEAGLRWVVKVAAGDARKIIGFLPLAPTEDAETEVHEGPAPTSKGGRPRAEFDVALAARLRSEGMSVRRVAKIVGVPKSTLETRLKQRPGTLSENRPETPSDGVSGQGFRTT